MQHVIIGAGPAGVIAAETLRKLDANAAITIVGDEPEPPYSRMAIPYFLSDKIAEQGTYLRKIDGYYDHHDIEIVQDRASALAPGNNTVHLQAGSELRYDRLLMANGSSPIKPPIEGLNLAGVHTCWTLDDARHIVQRAMPGSKVLLMGAGFIGCIILEALASRGVDLTVVEMENRMVPRMMNDQSGGLIKRWCEAKGVKVLTSTRVTGIAPGSGGHALDVSLQSGSAMPADLVICATGVRPDTALLDGTGIEVDHGILVNDQLQTSDPDIFAAGDVAQGKDFSTGEYSVQAIQPTAADHGRIAASNMVEGGHVVHQGSVNMNVLDTMGLVSASFGLWQGADGGDSAELSDPEHYRYLNLQFLDDVLVGANSLGLTQHVGVLRGLIQTRSALGRWKQALMDNPLNIMEAYLAATQGVGHTTRLG